MSTKAIEEVVKAYMRREHAARSRAGTALAREAMRELVAVGTSAMTISRWGVGDVCGPNADTEWDGAFRARDEAEALMETIAKENP